MRTFIVLPLATLAACEPAPRPSPSPDQPPPVAARPPDKNGAANRAVLDAALASGYAFRVCTRPTREVDKVVMTMPAQKEAVDLVPTANGYCHQFDGLRRGEPRTYGLRPEDNSLVPGIEVCAPAVTYEDDAPDPNPCVPIRRMDEYGFYAFVVYPRSADEPVIEIGTLIPGKPLMVPAHEEVEVVTGATHAEPDAQN